MSCPNFETQRDFDLFVFSVDMPDDDYIKDWADANECDVEDFDFYDFADMEYRCEIDNFKWELKHALNHFKRSLQWHEITLKNGYYDGIQMYVEETTGWCDVEDMTNEDTRYEFDMCRSEFLRKYRSEQNFINNKLLPYIAERTGFRKLNCLGVFSNGEAVYEYAA